MSCSCHFQPSRFTSAWQPSNVSQIISKCIKYRLQYQSGSKTRRNALRALALKEEQMMSLKEWAPVCAAIGCGDQTILLRKGGIKEPTFIPAAQEFFLFPTAFHTEAKLIKSESAVKFSKELQYNPRTQPYIELSVYAQVTGVWRTFNPDVSGLLESFHVWGPDFLESRLKWREKQPITVLELRAYRLHDPVVLTQQDNFWGCFSWLDLPNSCLRHATKDQILGQMSPALSDAAFAERQLECRDILTAIEAHELQLPDG